MSYTNQYTINLDLFPITNSLDFQYRFVEIAVFYQILSLIKPHKMSFIWKTEQTTKCKVANFVD